MSNFNNIQQKLQQFIKKYYTNELIKGLLLFVTFGLLYLFITLFIEYFLWLPPNARSVLFYVFVFVEVGLLIKLIILPITKLLGLQQGISFAEASKIIGNHFPEVDDKLLNVLQLNKNPEQSELLLASIEQKSAGLQPIPFRKAINFKNNRKYIKYLLIPLVIWLFTFLSGNNKLFKESFTRVVHYKTAYEPPAPFHFKVLNDTLTTVENQPFELQIETVGEIIPQNVQIYFNNQNYLLKDNEKGIFSYAFSNLKEPVTFYLEANGIQSKNYQLQVVKIPVITGFEMYVDYPAYTGKKDELIKNTGNAFIPEGTSIRWNIQTQETDSVMFTVSGTVPFQKTSKNSFSITKRFRQNVSYQITTSNRKLKNYEKLNYSIEVLKDEYPKIEVKSDIDSVSRGSVQFAGQLSDDYGLKKLNLVYFLEKDKSALLKQPIEINESTFEEFYYIFSPVNLKIKEGEAYQMYFEVYDNDAVNGSKSTKSNVFTYYNKTKQEITDDLLKEQQQNLDELHKTVKKSEELSKDFEEFSKKLKKKSELNWNDKKEFEQFLKRQEKYQQLLEKNTNQLKENLDEQELNTEDPSIKNKKEELKKRIEEAQKLQKKNKLLEELKKMAEKLDKEKMLQKLDKLTQQSKQEKRSLERLLELTKRFFVEKKAVQITKKLDSLSKNQEKQANKEDNNSESQQKLNKDFEEIRKDFKELNKQNRNLAEPMKLPTTKKEEENIEELMQQSTDFLKEQETLEKEKNASQKEQSEPQQKKAIKAATKSQKSAAKKQQQLSEKMKGAMAAMQGESIDENIDDLRAILENLLTFSFNQEKLMISFEGIDAGHAEFPAKLKRQHVLKEHFEHIDDSLYTLSLRLQQLSSNIQEYLTEAHYNIDKSLENIAENRIRKGISNQHYTMTAANNLANMLSNVLNSLQNPGMGSGQGKGNSFSLPDIIKKQKGLSEKMKKGMKKGQKPGKGNEGGKQQKEGKTGRDKQGGNKEQMTGEQYQLYQEQNALRNALQEILNKEGKSGAAGQKALQQMEELEKQLLDKGFTNEVLQRMIHLEHELLKLEKARIEQGKDTKRKSRSNTENFQNRTIPQIKNKKLYFNTNEILNREPLPLRNTYKKKVQEYFKDTTNE